MKRRLARILRGPAVAILPLTAWVALISQLPTPPNDLFWHMRVGELIATTGHIPETNLFSWTVPADTPYVYGAWLGELLLYGLYRLGGLELVVFTRNLLAAFLLGLVALETRRRVGSWPYVGLAVAGAGLLLLNNVAVRPQMFAWVPFGLTVLLLGRYGDGRLSIPALVGSLTGLMVFWVNVHGSFLLGLAVVGGVLAGEALDRRPRPASDMRRARLGGMALALGAMALATLANPRGPGIYRYVSTLLTDTPTQRYVTEWQPPTLSGPVNLAFFGTVLILLAVWAYLRPSPRMRDVAVVCGLLWLAWRSYRYVMWYGVVGLPILVEGLARLRPASAHDETRAPAAEPKPERVAERALEPAFTRATSLKAAVLLVPILLVQPWFLRELGGARTGAGGGPESFAAPVLTRATPVAAVEYLRSHPGGRLFNELGYGSYLIWALHDVPVFIDPRVEMYSLELVEDYLAISAGYDVPALLERYGVERVLLSRERQPKLSLALGRSDGWERAYVDAEAEIWSRRAAVGTSD